MLDNICRILEKQKARYIRIDGKTTSDQRSFFVDRFNTIDDYRCAVLSITAANSGITLTAADLVVFGELHWNPSILTQAESRAHRIGQANQVEVRYLLAAGTADDHIWQMIQSKTDVLNAAGLSKDCFKDTASSVQTDTATAETSFSSQASIKDYFQNNSSCTKENFNSENISNFNINSEDFEDDILADFSLSNEDDEALASLSINL